MSELLLNFRISAELAEQEKKIIDENPHFKLKGFRSMIYELGLIKWQQQNQKRKS